MNYIVLDLEATCWDKNEHPPEEMEVIEIGAIKYSKNPSGYFEKSEFQAFIKPQMHPELSSFCKKLTKIKQADVDKAETFDKVVSDFKTFIGKEYLLCSWGFYDRKQLTLDCNRLKSDINWLKNHISLKHQYQTNKGLKRGIGVSQALKALGMRFQGTPHRGIDDARNIFRIFKAEMDNWSLSPMEMPKPKPKKKVADENPEKQPDTNTDKSEG